MPGENPEVTPIQPEIRASEGAMAHEQAGYSQKIEDEVEKPAGTEITEAAAAAGDAVVSEAATQIPVTDASSGSANPNSTEDTRWDIDKAATVGIAARESEAAKGETGRYPDAFRTNHIEKAQEYFASADYRDNRTDQARQELESTKAGIAEREAAGEEIPRHIAERLPKDQAEYDAAVAEDEIGKEKHIEEVKSEREQDIERVIKRFEGVYSLNPELFVKMPTTEFISITREADGLIYDLRESRRIVSEISHSMQLLERAVTRQELPGWSTVEQIIGLIGTNLKMNNDDYDELTNRFEAAVSGFFDKTPRQIAEEYISIGKDYLARAETSHEATDQKRQEFVDKYKPQDSGTTEAPVV